MIKRGEIPQGMTMADAVKEYQENKTVITANDGELRVEGVECTDCHSTHPSGEMKYCECDEGLVCRQCCGHCGFNQDDICTWE